MEENFELPDDILANFEDNNKRARIISISDQREENKPVKRGGFLFSSSAATETDGTVGVSSKSTNPQHRLFHHSRILSFLF